MSDELLKDIITVLVIKAGGKITITQKDIDLISEGVEVSLEATSSGLVITSNKAKGN